MRSLTFYKIISYILLPFGAFMGMMALLLLLASLGNAAMLMLVFILGSVAIYVFTSFSFFQNGIVRNQALKHSLKDWIKVNGYVALFFSILMIVQGVYVLFHPSLLEENFKAMEDMALTQGAETLDKNLVLKAATGFLYFFIFFCSLLFIHIGQTFRLIKRYLQIFSR
jgi:hypothetical protein